MAEGAKWRAAGETWAPQAKLWRKCTVAGLYFQRFGRHICPFVKRRSSEHFLFTQNPILHVVTTRTYARAWVERAVNAGTWNRCCKAGRGRGRAPQAKPGRRRRNSGGNPRWLAYISSVLGAIYAHLLKGVRVSISYLHKTGDGGVKMVKAYRYAFRLSARLCLRPHSGGYGGADRTPITLSC